MVKQKSINTILIVLFVVVLLIAVPAAILSIISIIYASTTDNGTQGPAGIRGPTGATGPMPRFGPYSYSSVTNFLYTPTNNVATFVPGSLIVVDGRLSGDSIMNIRLPDNISNLRAGDTFTIFNNTFSDCLDNGLVIRVNGRTLLAPRSSNPPLLTTASNSSDLGPDRTFVAEVPINQAISLTLQGNGQPSFSLAISSR